MNKAGGAIHLTASDLVGHLDCHYVTHLDLAVASGTLAKPKIWDPVLEVLVERGALHEKDYLEHLKTKGFSLTVIDGIAIEPVAVAKTLDAMKAGAAIIVQGALKEDHWADAWTSSGALRDAQALLAHGPMKSLIPSLHAKRRAGRSFKSVSTPTCWLPH